MKGIQKRNDCCVFRVNTFIYPKKLIEQTFGPAKEELDEYWLYESTLSEEEIYEKFGEMLEALA